MSGTKFILLFFTVLALCSGPGYAWKQFAIDSTTAPSPGILSNSFIDILYNDGLLWLAGGQGLSKSADRGATWVTYNKASGLTSDEPSAITAAHPASGPDEIWVAGSYSQLYQGVSYPFGAGFSRTTDNGQSWTTVTPPDSSASAFGKLAYDLSASRKSVYAACYYGGLIVHHFGENDTTWHHIFFSPEDSTDWFADHWPNLPTGRYYSCVVDTFHNGTIPGSDTLMVYAGSAHGIQKFYYLPKRVKLGGNQIFDIAGKGNTVFLASEGGVSRTDTLFSSFLTYDTLNGLPVNSIRKLFLFGGRIWAAPFDTLHHSDTLSFDTLNFGGIGRGLYSADTMSLQSWTEVNTSLFAGADSIGVYDVKTVGDSEIYIATGNNGLVRSLDTGRTWSQIFPSALDSNPASPRNHVYSFDLRSDTLYLGTKAGLVKAAYHGSLVFDHDTLITFPENDTSGTFVNLVRHLDTIAIHPDTLGVPDTTRISFTWLSLAPQTPSGRYTTIFIDSTDTMRVILNSDAGPVPTRQIVVYSSALTLIAAAKGLYASPNNGSPGSSAREPIIDTSSGRILNSFEKFSLAILNGRAFIGSSHGVAYRYKPQDWRIRFANTDPLVPDLAVQRTRANSNLPGEWVVALGVQPFGPSAAVLWAACRSVPDTIAQRNAVAFSTDYGTTWDTALTDLQAWNFGFADSATFVPTSSGLYYAHYPWCDTCWSKATIIDHTTHDTLNSATEVFCANVIGDTLWVGTGMGLATTRVSDLNGWHIRRTFKPSDDAADVFAAPVPYSPINNSGRLTLHYRVPATANVTVEIYDFAMHLVRTVALDKPRAGGQDYFETWDGYNEKGRMAATGMYFFKVSLSTGDVHWGRLAIIP